MPSLQSTIELTPQETAIIDAVQRTLAAAVAQLATTSPLYTVYHGALCDAERRLGREISVPGRKARRNKER